MCPLLVLIQVEAAPYCSFHAVDASGKLERTVPLHSLKRASMMHDFAITETHALFLDFPFLFKPSLLAKGKLPFQFCKVRHYYYHVPADSRRTLLERYYALTQNKDQVSSTCG